MRLPGQGAALRQGSPGVEETVGHVVERRHARQQEELLEHEADLARPQARELAVREQRLS